MSKCAVCGKEDSDESTVVVHFGEGIDKGCCLFCAASVVAAVADQMPKIKAEMRRLADRVNQAEGGMSCGTPHDLGSRVNQAEGGIEVAPVKETVGGFEVGVGFEASQPIKSIFEYTREDGGVVQTC